MGTLLVELEDEVVEAGLLLEAICGGWAAGLGLESAKFPAYQADITAYTAALLAHRCDANINYDAIWTRQGVSAELKAALLDWAHAVGGAPRRTAGIRMPTEWAKRPDCWEAEKVTPVSLPNCFLDLQS